MEPAKKGLFNRKFFNTFVKHYNFFTKNSEKIKYSREIVC